MPNDFFNNAIDLTPFTKARAGDVEANFSAVEAGFDLVAPKNNPTFTGTVTVPTPLTATAAATKAYVDAITVAVGNVPTGGTTGQALVKTGNGDYAMAWGQAGFGLGGTTITGSVTLTAASAGSTTVTPTAPGLYATLPDATTCSKANNLFLITNAGDYDYGVKDSAGTVLGWIRARTGAFIGLSDNSTAAGVWSYQGLEKLGITASFSNATLTGMDGNNTLRRITLDTNRTCFLIGGTSCYAIVYDASTSTWGSATLVRASIGSGRFAGVLSATNQVLVFTCDTSTAGQAVTLTISGTTVTVNTPVAKTLPATISAVGSFIPVSASWVFAFATGTASYIIAFSVSGTVPTVGTEAALAGDAGVAANIYVSGSIVRCVTMTGASVVTCRPYTVSGVTLTAGTAAAPAATGSQFRSFVNVNGNIVAHYNNTTHTATVFKLTGTVEAASSVSIGVAHAGGSYDYVQVTASKIAFLSGASGTWSANILTDTAGTATAGTELTGVASGTPSIAQLPSTGNNASFAFGESGSVYSVRNFDCSGSSPVATTVLRTSLGSTNTIAIPARTLTSGIRGAANLIAGQTLYSVSIGVPTVGDFSTNRVGARVIRPPICADFASVGETGNIGYATATISSTVGVQIQKIEAAA